MASEARKPNQKPLRAGMGGNKKTHDHPDGGGFGKPRLRKAVDYTATPGAAGSDKAAETPGIWTSVA
jgi:hypothetical protein